MTEEDATAWRERWLLVNAFQREEYRRLSIEDRFRQLASLMASARSLGWVESLAREDAAAHARWLDLYRAYGAVE